MAGIQRAVHRQGAVCFARPRGCPSRWLLAHVIQAWPLVVEVIEDDPVWRGAVLNQTQARIRVDPKHWPRERRSA